MQYIAKQSLTLGYCIYLGEKTFNKFKLFDKQVINHMALTYETFNVTSYFCVCSYWEKSALVQITTSTLAKRGFAI